MNKELQALQDLSKLVFIYGGVEQYKLIEKALKALEIIKNKNVDVGLIKNCVSAYAYNDSKELSETCFIKRKEIAQEEFDLLKEVLL